MVIKALELLSLSTFAGCSLFAQMGPSPPMWVFQFGALGIVGFMVFQNYRQMRETNKVLAYKNRQIEKQNVRLLEAEENLARALEHVANSLNNRTQKED